MMRAGSVVPLLTKRGQELATCVRGSCGQAGLDSSLEVIILRVVVVVESWHTCAHAHCRTCYLLSAYRACAAPERVVCWRLP